jgi:rSAM/selenodomain-associated transferase 2
VKHRLSVVIPTLNAAAALPTTLTSVAEAHEVIVVDGGSSDRTVAVAEAMGARVIAAPKGRGTQLAAGVDAARGDWLLLLHADTRLEDRWHQRLWETERPAPGLGQEGCPRADAAYYFRFNLDIDDPHARRLERIVAWRCRVLALPYGDQGLLIHRNLLQTIGGIRPLPLMEDVDLVRRLGRRRLVGLEIAAITSAEKWRRQGWYRRSLRNLLCLSLYFLGVPPSLIGKLYG